MQLSTLIHNGGFNVFTGLDQRLELPAKMCLNQRVFLDLGLQPGFENCLGATLVWLSRHTSVVLLLDAGPPRIGRWEILCTLLLLALAGFQPPKSAHWRTHLASKRPSSESPVLILTSNEKFCGTPMTAHAAQLTTLIEPLCLHG